MNTLRALTRRGPNAGAHAAALALLALASIGAVASAGCTDKACIQWSADKGVCPSKEDAVKRFFGQSCDADIQTVLTEGQLDGDACCYEVEKRGSGELGCGAVGAGPSGPSVAPCGGCAAFQAGEAPDICEASVPLFNALVECLCSGPCAEACDDGSCATSFDTVECQTCVADTQGGCGEQLNACSNDQ
jgi:hypothetical protein